MNLNELFAHLQDVRDRHGGHHPVMLGQKTPGPADTWSGIPLQPGMVRETIDESSFNAALGYGRGKAGWIWFEIPEGGIQHRTRKNPRS